MEGNGAVADCDPGSKGRSSLTGIQNFFRTDSPNSSSFQQCLWGVGGSWSRDDVLGGDGRYSGIGLNGAMGVTP